MSIAEVGTGIRGLGWLGRLFESLIGRRKIKRSLLEIASTLESIKLRLESILTRLEHRDKELFEVAVRALISGDRDRASIYASEVLEVRKLMKNVRTVSLALEKAKLRLETLTTVEEMGVALPNVVAILEAVKPQLQMLSPELAATVDKVILEVNNLVLSTQAPVPRLIEAVTAAPPEAEKVLKEVEKQAEKEIEEKLPKLPDNLVKLAEEKKPIAVQLKKSEEVKDESKSGHSTSEDKKSKIKLPKPQRLKKIMTLDELESRVLEYIINHGGFLDVTSCAMELDVSREAVLKALENLKMKGKIRIAQ